MKFRLTIGENGTPWGKQTVIETGEAENAIEFLQTILKRSAPDARYTKANRETRQLLDNCWVDAGKDTIGIAVCNLKY